MDEACCRRDDAALHVERAGRHADSLPVAITKMAGEEGFEPSNAGIKIRCLNQLGDSPAETCATFDSAPAADQSKGYANDESQRIVLAAA